MNFWDQNFSAPGYKYGTAPNAFLADQATRLQVPSDVLLPGDGEGRNGVWLAQQGHHVTAVDSSRVGLDKAKALAQERGVNISTVLAGQKLGIKEVDEGIWLVSFMHYDLGYIDLEQKTLQPLDNPFGPGLSPMS